MTKRKRRAFNDDFKADAVRLVKAGDRTIGQVAKELDLTETALREWVKRDAVDAGKAPPEALTTVEREELVRLRRDNKRLLMERDILKNHPGRRPTCWARSFPCCTSSGGLGRSGRMLFGVTRSPLKNMVQGALRTWY